MEFLFQDLDQCDNCGKLLNPTELQDPRCKLGRGPRPRGVAGVRHPSPWEVLVSGSVEDARGHQCDNCGKLLNP